MDFWLIVAICLFSFILGMLAQAVFCLFIQRMLENEIDKMGKEYREGKCS